MGALPCINSLGGGAKLRKRKKYRVRNDGCGSGAHLTVSSFENQMTFLPGQRARDFV